MLNRAFGSLILHEITAHRIEQFKRERLAGKWRGHGHKSAREADSSRRRSTANSTRCKSIFSKAVEWGKLLESPDARRSSG